MFKKSNLGLLCIVLAVFMGLGTVGAFAGDYYKNYADLAAHEKYGKDYSIDVKEKGPKKSKVAVIAIHGGKIQPGTSEIARLIAGNDWNYYSFNGLKSSNNYDLFIKAIRFDEPKAVDLVAKSELTISIIGADDDQPIIYIGGRDEKSKMIIKRSLKMFCNLFGVYVADAPIDMAGEFTTNICNENKSGAGVQIAVSRGLRDLLFNDFCSNGKVKSAMMASENAKKKDIALAKFTEALQTGIDQAADQLNNNTGKNKKDN